MISIFDEDGNPNESVLRDIEAASKLPPGDALATIYILPDGRLMDLVIVSIVEVPSPMTQRRTVALADMGTGHEVLMYETTHCDSGHPMASVESRDVWLS
ncbi:hypothetical protein [Longimicrobium sp.]|uniref:hypothetical protein n=1 Tax=Longimicrobium sp. TaxID=2029185 RepID=UPI002ED9FE31